MLTRALSVVFLPAQKSLTVSVCFSGWNQSMSQRVLGNLTVLKSQRNSVGPDSSRQALAGHLGHSVTEYDHGFGQPLHPYLISPSHGLCNSRYIHSGWLAVSSLLSCLSLPVISVSAFPSLYPCVSSSSTLKKMPFIHQRCYPIRCYFDRKP